MLHRYVRYCRLAITLLVLVVLMMALWTATALAQEGGGAPTTVISPVSTLPIVWYLLAAGLALLVPAGFVLIAVANLEPRRAWNTALGGLAAIGLAAFAYWVIGFALQFGGVGLVYPHAELRGLVWEWSPLSSEWGIGWGMAGLSGWFLSGAHVTALAYTLFLSHLPWVMLAAALPIMSLRGRAPSTVTLIVAVIVGGLVYPLAGNWVQGGGWLNALGRNLTLGHGFIDMGGAGTVHLVAAGFALAAMTVWARRRRDPKLPTDAETMPPAHQPLLVVVGALLILGGVIGWQFANPLQVESIGNLGMIRGAVSIMLAAAGGMLFPLLYTWFVSGASEPTLTARGLAAGVVAGLAMGPFVQPGIAFVVGLLAGATVPFVTYLLDGRLRLRDATGIVATSGIPAVIGLLLVGLFADGAAGSGWQMTGAGNYLGVAGQGVSGLLVASGFQPDFPGQFQSQLIGVAALGLWGFLSGLIVCIPLGFLFHSLLQDRSDAPAPMAGAVAATSGLAARPAAAPASDPFANVPYRSEPRGAEGVRPTEAAPAQAEWRPVEPARTPESRAPVERTSGAGSSTMAASQRYVGPAATPSAPIPAPADAPLTSSAPPAQPAPSVPPAPSSSPAAPSVRQTAREGYWPADAAAPSAGNTNPLPAASTGVWPGDKKRSPASPASGAGAATTAATAFSASTPVPADPYVALEPATDPTAASLLDSALDSSGIDSSGLDPSKLDSSGRDSATALSASPASAAPGAQAANGAPPLPLSQSVTLPGETPLMRRRRSAMPPLPGGGQPT